MDAAILACETIRDELESAIKIVGSGYPIKWVESGLHNYPGRLRKALQGQLDSLDGHDCVLMAFGSCGNAAVGLRTGGFRLIMPRVDDCITLLIGSAQKRAEIGKGAGIYYLTPGWLRGERSVWAEYCHAVDKYGEQTAGEIMDAMLKHFTYLGVLDTKCYNLDEALPEFSRIAGKLKLTQRIIPASVEYLCDLLTGPWEDKRFLVVEPYTAIPDFP